MHKNKIYIITIEYSSYATTSEELAMDFLNIHPVSVEYIDGKLLYVPKETSAKIERVDSDLVREITPIEAENKRIATLESSLNWKTTESADLKKQVEELKCKLKLLTEEKDEPI